MRPTKAAPRGRPAGDSLFSVNLGSRRDEELLRRCGAWWEMRVWWGQELTRGWVFVVGEAKFKELDFGGGKIKDGGLSLILGGGGQGVWGWSRMVDR